MLGAVFLSGCVGQPNIQYLTYPNYPSPLTTPIKVFDSSLNRQLNFYFVDNISWTTPPYAEGTNDGCCSITLKKQYTGLPFVVPCSIGICTYFTDISKINVTCNHERYEIQVVNPSYPESQAHVDLARLLPNTPNYQVCNDLISKLQSGVFQ